MNGASTFREAMHRLVMRELGSRRDPQELATAAVGIYETLLKVLSPLLGNVGSLALFRRSLKLTEGAFPCYVEARVAKEDALFEAVRACLRQQQVEVAQEASVALMIAFVELLVTFIGERLTWQLLQETWPELLRIPSEETH